MPHLPVESTQSRDVAHIADRLMPPMPSHGIRGWIGPLVVAAIGAVLRLWNLGTPHAIAFDETYYVKDALSLLRFGVEREMAEGAGDTLLASDGNWRTIDIFKPGPEYVVHPPRGKWTIATGEYVFGATPFGWRIAVAVLGILAILMTARIARRLTRSDLIGTLAGLLLALDGIHLVMSRTGLLDMVLAFWVLAAFGLLVLDRDRTRARLGALVSSNGLDSVASAYGPPFGVRPLRWAALVALGLACSVKWSGLWFVAFFIAMSVVWDVGARRAIGVRHPWRATLLREVPSTAALTLAIVIAVYLLSWTGWFISDGGWARNWAASQGPSVVPDALRSLWAAAQALKLAVAGVAAAPGGNDAVRMAAAKFLE